MNNKLTMKQALTIGGVVLIVFGFSVWVSLTLGDYLAEYIGPAY